MFAFCSKLSSFKSAGLGTDEEDASSKKNVSFSATTFASKSSSSTFSSLVFSFVSFSFSFSLSSSLKKNESFFDDLKVAALFFQFVFVCFRRRIRLVLGTPKKTTQRGEERRRR